MTAIVDIIGREILDSRGNPTVEVDVVLEYGSVGRAAVSNARQTSARVAGFCSSHENRSRWTMAANSMSAA